MATTATLPAYELPGVPVHHPAHLEGDPTLATEILPGPPSLVSAQQSAQKRDPKKPSTFYSYLPATDPGSTYSGLSHGTLISLEEPRSKRSRADKGASGRAQRASARNQNAMSVAIEPTTTNDAASALGHQPEPAPLEPEPSSSGAVDDDFAMSRSNSSLNLQDPPIQPLAIQAARRDKGKGKDIGTPPIRGVKEESKSALLNTPEPGANVPKNNDHCSSCRSNGALVYCDGCPRAFHLWCLDPPMESIDEGDSNWFCPACVIRKHPPRKPPASLLSSLIHQLDMSIPVEFQLPDDIRNFFRDVGSGPRGAYVDLQEIKPPRLNRLGLPEERDPHRLRDRNGAPVLCFKCGMSALPTGMASTVPTSKRPRRSTSKAATPEGFKSIVSCDFCNHHWHLDCLDPPLSAMPPQNKKWICPMHAECLIPSKRRVPKHNASPIEITKPKQFNNGHIDVIQPESSTVSARPRVKVDEVLINGRRYRVPEKIIILDFWNKVSKHDFTGSRDVEMASGLSSPLTSLSSLDDHEEGSSDHTSPAVDELRAAQALFNLSHSKPATVVPTTNTAQRLPTIVMPSKSHSNSSSLSSVPPSASTSTSGAPTTTRPGRSAKKAASLKIASINANLNGIETPTPGASVPRETGPTIAVSVASARRARRAPQTQATPVQQAEASTRELRSRSRNTTQDSSSSVASAKTARTNAAASPVDSLSVPLPPPSNFRTISVKMEEIDNVFSMSNGFETSSVSTNGRQATPSTKRRRRATMIRDPGDASKTDKMDTTEKWSRKRKVRDDDLPEVIKKPASEAHAKKSKRSGKEVTGGRGKVKGISTPLRPAPSSGLEMTPTSASSRLPPLTPLTVAAKPVTPTLKIRLPRLNSTSKATGPSLAITNADTPTRL